MIAIKIRPEEFDLFSKYLSDISGIHLQKEKSYLLENRLNAMFRDTGAKSFYELYQKIRSDKSNKLEHDFLDVMTTNETLFFRDKAPFELLRHKIIPDLIDRRVPDGDTDKHPLNLKIWSAACSTGQEVYSIAIVLKELLGDISRHNISIKGTDISDEAVKRASYGHYNWVEIERGLSPQMLNRYFTKAGDEHKIDDEIRSMASFQKLNLMNNFSSLGTFDIIFCRNVAIYFNEDKKKSLFDRIGQILKPDGVLIIGGTESIVTLCPQYESKRYLRSIYYQLK